MTKKHKAKEHVMSKGESSKKAESSGIERTERPHESVYDRVKTEVAAAEKKTAAIAEAVAPAGSTPRIAAGVAGAAAGALIAAAWLGVGPAALAGAAGYLAYRGLKHKPITPIESH